MLNRGVFLVCLLGNGSLAVAQQDLFQEVRTLNQQVVELYGQGRYKEAIPLAQKVVAITEKVLGPEHPDMATMLNNLAELYYYTNAYTEARPLYQRALAIREKVLGSEHPDTAAALSNLASFYQDVGGYAKAEPLYQRALAIQEKVLGPSHPDTASGLISLAGLYDTMGPYAKAEPLLQQALTIREKSLGLEHPDTATALHNLAFHYATMGHYAKADPLYHRALAINEKVLGPEHRHTASVLRSLGELYHATGAYAKAEPLYQRALTIHEKTLGPEHPDTARLVNNLARFYQDTSDYTKAEYLYQRALAIQEKVLGPKHPSTADAVSGLARLYYLTGAYVKAESLLQRALTIMINVMELEHPGTAAVLNDLALLYRDIGAYAKAEPLLQRALTIQEKALGLEHPYTAVALNNLGLLYSRTETYSKAEPLYQRALTIQEKTLGSEHRETALSLNNLALLYADTGAYAKAEPLYLRALAIQEKVLGPEHPDRAMSLKNLGLLRWAMDDTAAALPLFELSEAINWKSIERFLVTGSESRKMAYLLQFQTQTSAATSLSLVLSGRRATTLGFTGVLQTKGRVLDAMSEAVVRLHQSVQPSDRALVNQLIALAQEQSVLTHRASRDHVSADLRQRLQELMVQQDQLESELSARNAEFRRQVVPITLEAVQAAIPKDAALVEWYRFEPFNVRATSKQSAWGNPRYVAYVVRQEGEPVAVDVGEAASIDHLIQDFRTGLSDPRSTYVKDVSQELSDRLLKPLQLVLVNAKHLLISPDSALNQLPFAALVDETGMFLGSNKVITYLTSGRDLLRLNKKAIQRGNPMLVANPSFGKANAIVGKADLSDQKRRSADFDREGKDFKPLSGTAEEVKALKTLLNVGADNVLMQGEATEGRIKRLHGPRILHIATHGFFLKKEVPTTALRRESFSQGLVPVSVGDNPLLRSGLALAGANQRRSGKSDDGILTAAEVAQIDLRGTQLVVLSACETGVGDVKNGEGVYGLRRALVLAGAESQVMSLWKVADEATKDLMVDYYTRLLRGEGRSEALRNAQLTMMKSKGRSHPYYWAAFVPIGDWRPLSKEH